MKLLQFNERGGGNYSFRIQDRDFTYFGKMRRHEFKSKFWEARQIGAILRGDEIRQMSDRNFQIVKRSNCEYLSITTFFRKNDHCDEIQETNIIPIKPICKASVHEKNKESLQELPAKRQRLETKDKDITGFIFPTSGQPSVKQEASDEVKPSNFERDLSVRVKTLEDSLRGHMKMAQMLEEYTMDIKDQLSVMKEKLATVQADNILLKKHVDVLEERQDCERESSNFMRSTLQLIYLAQPFDCRFYYNNTARLDRLQHEVALCTTSRNEQRYFYFLCQHPRFQEYKSWLQPRRGASLIYTVTLRNVPRECECLLNPIDVFKFGKMAQIRDFYASGSYAKICTYQQRDVDFLVTMYELNLEHELHNKVLLPGGVFVVGKSVFQQCMSKHVENIGSHTFALKVQVMTTLEEDVGAGKQKTWSDKLGFFVTMKRP